ncbi:MAG: endonuclease/exonuclease/phosphatase family protein, partial [Bacteroidales bacterium]
MKKTLKIRLFIITLLAGIGVQAQTLPKVSFMTYNIQGHAVTDQRIKDAATVINSVSPEVVAIQEVDMRPYLFRHDYLKDLADSTGMHH